MTSSLPTLHARRRALLPTLTFFLTILCAQTLCAQIPAPQPMKKMYGVDDNEFLISAWCGVRPDTSLDPRDTGASGPITQLWGWLGSLGVGTIRYFSTYESELESIDALLADTVDRVRSGLGRNRIIATHVEPVMRAGRGLEAVFYPDSSRWRFDRFRCRFLATSGGRDAANGFERDDFGKPAAERVYDAATTKPGECVARGAAFEWNPLDPVNRKADHFFNYWREYVDYPRQNNLHGYIDVAAHLFGSGGTAKLTDTILRIELVYQIPKGEEWHDARGYRKTATEDLEWTIVSRGIQKLDLLPNEAPQHANWDRYHRITIPFDPQLCRNGFFGPLHEKSLSCRVDLRVYWTGKERVALRSVSIRDSIAQTVLGSDFLHDSMRVSMERNVSRILYGPDWRSDSARLRPEIIAIASGIEQHPYQASSYATLYKLLRGKFGANKNERLPAWTEGEWVYEVHQLLDTAGECVTAEIAMDNPNGGDAEVFLEAPTFVQPSIPQHNGGRFIGQRGVNLYRSRYDTATRADIPNPVLALHPDSIDQVYETSIQRCRWGQYSPFPQPWPHERMLTYLGRAAEVSRDRRRRLIGVIFNSSRMVLTYEKDKTGSYRPSVEIPHIPEPAELRTMVNLALCYGARGIHYQSLDAHHNLLDSIPPTARDTAAYVGHCLIWGSNGPFMSDTSVARHDRLDTLWIFRRGADGWYHGKSPQIPLTNFYTGWGSRTRETKAINAWLERIGPELVKLDWRDGYSAHFTVRQPFDGGGPEWKKLRRPLPFGEIVNKIESFGRRWQRDAGITNATWMKDSAHRTFVELGLFRTKNTTADPLRDTNHIFAMNRRSFERPYDIVAASDTGRVMDSLAEVRDVMLSLNVPRRVFARDGRVLRVARVFVREVEPDVAPLPLEKTPRVPLDTCLPADGVVRLRLGPGRAALLRITYAPADSAVSVDDGSSVDPVRRPVAGNEEWEPRWSGRNPEPAGGVAREGEESSESAMTGVAGAKKRERPDWMRIHCLPIPMDSTLFSYDSDMEYHPPPFPRVYEESSTSDVADDEENGEDSHADGETIAEKSHTNARGEQNDEDSRENFRAERIGEDSHADGGTIGEDSRENFRAERIGEESHANGGTIDEDSHENFRAERIGEESSTSARIETGGESSSANEPRAESSITKYTLPLAAPADPALAVRIEALPNPTRDVAVLRFTLPRGDVAEVVLYDSRGDVVLRPLARTLLSAGDYALEFSAADLPTGTYVALLQTTGGRGFARLIVAQ